jgi:hypothetical protein
MRSTSPPLMSLTWPLWKENWRDVLATAALSASLEAGALCLFLYMFIQIPSRVLPIVGGSFRIFLFFHVGVSALHAKLITHPAFSDAFAQSASAQEAA